MSQTDSDAKPATRFTAEANRRVVDELDFSDRRDFENASRGFLAGREPVTWVRERDGKVVYDLSGMEFLRGECPPSVNPSLWRQCQLNTLHRGLYEVTDGIYQVRGFDLANMTVIRGDSGWIVIDPLTSQEASRAALDLVREELGDRPVVAVMHTHSHADHFGGVFGVTSQDEIEAGQVQVLAPRNYTREALSENVMAGNVMNRRASFMFGNWLEPAPTAFVGNGLGPALSMGTTGFAVPTDIIRETGEQRRIDGIDFEFQWTPGTEAPTEMVFFLPQFRALCMSEITSHHLHNVYTPRGAQTRDALAWARQIQESMDLFGDRLEVQFACHHWPIWGQREVLDYLEKQRDLYKFLHDQTLRWANHGLGMHDIAERLRLPRSLAREFYNRDYYGTLRHNSKAVYNYYLGYFDGHPAELDRLPPVETARRTVEFMGGAEAVLEKARDSFEQGDYRWVAQVLRHVVLTDGENQQARRLMADALEQLGYQAESGPWRNFYLTGARELRHGTPPGGIVKASEGIARNMPMRDLYDSLAVRLDAEAAEDVRIVLRAELSDLERTDTLVVQRCVLHAYEGRDPTESGDSEDGAATHHASLRCTSRQFKRLMLGLVEAEELRDSRRLEIGEEDALVLQRLLGLFDQFRRSFPLVFAPQEPGT